MVLMDKKRTEERDGEREEEREEIEPYEMRPQFQRFLDFSHWGAHVTIKINYIHMVGEERTWTYTGLSA